MEIGFLTISIHAPRGGSDPGTELGGILERLFQSTLPVGGATGPATATMPATLNFNPRSPWGERRHRFTDLGRRTAISIHAPRGGSDAKAKSCAIAAPAISIHAPRGGSDYTST